MDTIQTTPSNPHHAHKGLKIALIIVLIIVAFLLGMWTTSAQAARTGNRLALFTQTLNEMNPELAASVSSAVSARSATGATKAAAPSMTTTPAARTTNGASVAAPIQPVDPIEPAGRIIITYFPGGKCEVWNYNEAIGGLDGFTFIGAGHVSDTGGCTIEAMVISGPIGVANPPVFGKDISGATKDISGIKLLQSVLHGAGVYTQGTFTGIYDSSTQTAVKAYQKKMGIRETGIVDAATRAKLNQSKWIIREARF